MRKELKDVLIYGDFKLVEDGDDDVFAYERVYGKERAGVVCSFRERDVEWRAPRSWDLGSGEGKVLVSNYEDGLKVKDGKVHLKPFEAFAYHF